MKVGKHKNVFSGCETWQVCANLNLDARRPRAVSLPTPPTADCSWIHELLLTPDLCWASPPTPSVTFATCVTKSVTCQNRLNTGYWSTPHRIREAWSAKKFKILFCHGLKISCLERVIVCLFFWSSKSQSQSLQCSLLWKQRLFLYNLHPLIQHIPNSFTLSNKIHLQSFWWMQHPRSGSKNSCLNLKL